MGKPRALPAPRALLLHTCQEHNEIRRTGVIGSINRWDKLTEVQLAEWLSVSRPTIRGALNQLSEEGLLV